VFLTGALCVEENYADFVKFLCGFHRLEILKSDFYVKGVKT